MAATGFTPISLYYSATASAVPLAAKLTAGELALNTNDGKLYYKNSSGTVAQIAGPGAAGDFTNLTVTGNTTLGDASTDTVTVNGYMGVGGAANIASALTVGSPTLSGTTQRGIDSATTFGTGATTSVQQIRAISTLNAAGVYAEWIGLNVNQPQGSGYTLTNAYGLYINDQTKGTNNYGITSLVSSGTNKWNIYASGTAQNYFAGNVGIGTTSLNGITLRITKNITGGASSYAIYNDGQIQSDVTSVAYGMRTGLSTAASAFTLANLRHYEAQQGTIGAGSTVTNQSGFFVDSSLTGATNNYGFFGNIASGTNRWNFYANGTADNYFAGNVLVGTTTAASTQGATIQAIAAMAARRNIAAAGGPAFRMEKSRATTDGTYTIVANGDTLGEYQFYGADGVQYIIGASVKAVVDATPGVNDMPTALIFSTTADGAASVTERMRIDSSGKVGIGTNAPAVTLAISATDAVLVPSGTTAQRPTGAAGYIRYNSTTGQFEGYTTAWGAIGGGATGGGGDQIFYENGQTVNTSYTITASKNAGTFGPVTVASGVTVTVPSGSVWSVV